MIVQMYVGPPGCGKTVHIIHEIITIPGLYLFALPRTELIDEKARDLRRAAKKRGVPLRVEAVHGKQRWSSVPRRIEELATELTDEGGHAVLLISHDMLTRMDLSPFIDCPEPIWHSRIDECPDALASGTFIASAAAHYLTQVYDLVPSGLAGWWRVRLKADAPGPGALMRDTHLRDLVAFDKRARSLQGDGVLVNVGDWHDATLVGREVNWYSVWTPAALSGFASVGIAAANFATSLCGLASQRLDGGKLTYVEHRIGGAVERSTYPKVILRYFAQAHHGSTTWWAKGTGKRHLNRVLRHLITVSDLGFYSGNTDVLAYFEGWLDHAEPVTPKQAGTNRLVRHVCCAMIYSNKPQGSDAAIRSALGFTAEEIKRARETEDLIQFALRGAIRDPSFAGTYMVYVYDLAQAEAVRDYLVESGLTSDVVVEGVVEAGLLDEKRPDSKGVLKNEIVGDERTFEQREEDRREAEAERGRRRREAGKQKRMAEGTYRQRGRPKKDAEATGFEVAGDPACRPHSSSVKKGWVSTETRAPFRREWASVRRSRQARRPEATKGRSRVAQQARSPT